MKYPKVRNLGHEDTRGILKRGHVVLLEKIDGANFRFRYDTEADALVFGSRKVLFKEHGGPAPLGRVNKQFRHAVRHVSDVVDTAEVAAVDAEEDGAWFFGESLHKHSLDYDAWEGKHPEVDGDVPNALGFDVYSEGRDRFLPHDEAVDVFDRIGLETVPVVASGDADDFDEDDIGTPVSAFRDPDPDADDDFDREGLAEGVVVKNDDLDLRAKVVSEEFAEHSWAGQTPSERREVTAAAGAFVNQYATEMRVEKQARKLVDEGRYGGLQMGMMQDLPRRVAEDVFAEHGWDILNDDELELTADVKEEVRSRLSKRCSRVLRQMIEVEGE